MAKHKRRILATYIVLVALGLSAAIFVCVRSNHSTKSNLHESPAQLPTFVEFSQNAPSLKNLAPPKFDDIVLNWNEHQHRGPVRVFQLAKGEEHAFVRPGEMIHLHVHCTLAKDWWTYPTFFQGKYIYRNKINLSANDFVSIEGDVSSVPPASVNRSVSEVFGMDVKVHETNFYYDIPVRIAPMVRNGDSVISVSIESFATCPYM